MRDAGLTALLVLAVVAMIHAAVWQAGTSWLGSVFLWAVVAVLAIGAGWQGKPR